ncbi:BglG family transcription antiterminator [Streptococcus suis]|uniref:PTS modulated transcriptional regulator, MtlR family n=1 Tax=Streptococcus suis TaxID=1307 RepID=A0A0Z8KHV5_STRSU|nr:PRD domain-containing protein [Streptococcus suis]NQF81763.1 BglG family transcription antiterminator [Streptococcus suis]CYV72541.1 PTS modulated transcriptional regulator%2C MtlR family [Streptococcus suis]
MLNTKEKMILQYLYQHQNGFSTSKVLAEHLSYTDRTIRTYIKKLMSDLSEDKVGFTILSKQGYGYQLQISDEEAYQRFLSENQLTLGIDYSDADNRYKQILNKLIFEEECILFDDLADQLFVSRSTLSHDFKHIRKQLASYGLTIESKPYKGVYVVGDERQRRHFIMDYFFSEHFYQNIHHIMAGDKTLDLPLSFEELTIVVLDECRDNQMKLSDYIIQNLVIHLGLAIQRYQKGFKISPVAIDKEKYAKELSVATKISRRLSSRLGTDTVIPEEEITYIALHLISKSEMEGEKSSDRLLLRQTLVEVFGQYDTKYGFEFSHDFTLIEGVLTHLEVLLERVQHNIHIANPLLDDIKSTYLDIFNMTQSLMSDLSVFQSYTLSDSEIAYVTLHLMASLERQKEKHKLNVLVICATGYGSAQMLKNRIKNELGQQVSISDVIGYYDLDNQKLQGIDVIMSTIDLSGLVFKVPVITVSVFLTDQEVKEVKQRLADLRPSLQQSKVMVEESGLEDYFDHYFSEKRFFILDTAEKESLLSQMIAQMARDGLGDSEEFYKLIEGRERLSTVIFDQDIAVPHPLKAVSDKHTISVAIIKEGLAWEDGYDKVRLVFLVSPSIYTNEGLSVITNRLVDLVDLPDIKEGLITSPDFETFKHVFLQRE